MPDKPTPESIANARELRRTMTPTERILWRELRNQQLGGLKFRRQRPVGPYITDFCCLESHLIVELDGAVHDTQVEYDQGRDEYLSACGYRVLRFRNDEVLGDLAGVLVRIAAEVGVEH